MEKNSKKALEIFQKVLTEIHIPSKPTDKNFHEDTAPLYELAFDFAHKYLEGRQNLGLDPSVDCDEKGKEAYAYAEELKKLIENAIDENDAIGTDNVLRTLAERAEDVCGNLRRYVESEDDEEKDEQYSKTFKPSKGPKVPR